VQAGVCIRRCLFHYDQRQTAQNGYVRRFGQLDNLLKGVAVVKTRRRVDARQHHHGTCAPPRAGMKSRPLGKSMWGIKKKKEVRGDLHTPLQQRDVNYCRDDRLLFAIAP